GLVLIVEDEDQVRVLAESYLRENGHRTLSASTAAEALALLGVSDGIEILFTDIVLQGDVHGGLGEASGRTMPTTQGAVCDGPSRHRRYESYDGQGFCHS